MLFSDKNRFEPGPFKSELTDSIVLCCLPLLEFLCREDFIVKPYYCNIFLDQKKERYIDDLDTDMDKGIHGRDKRQMQRQRLRCRDLGHCFYYAMLRTGFGKRKGAS